MAQHMDVPVVDHARAARLFKAILAHADRSAAAVAAYLRANVPTQLLGPDGEIRISPEVALGLAAVLQIAAWEKAGLVGQLCLSLPLADLAYIDLLKRLRDPSGDDGKASILMRDVSVAWLRHFAWQAPAILGVDVVVDGRPSDFDLEELADFLWKNRHLTE